MLESNGENWASIAVMLLEKLKKKKKKSNKISYYEHRLIHVVLVTRRWFMAEHILNLSLTIPLA